MNVKGLHTSQVTYLPSLIKSLQNRGISTDKMLVRSKLHHFDVHNPDGFIPSIFLYDFLEQVQLSQGLYSIAGRFTKDFSLRNVGTFGQNMFLQPSLLQVVQSAVKFQHLLRTDNVLGYQINGNKFSFTFRMLGEPTRKRNILEDVALAQVLDGFRYVGGDNWFPLEIHTTSSSLKRMERVLGSGNFRLYCKQPENKVIFPLDFALKEVKPHSTVKQDIQLEEKDTLSKQITRLLRNTAPGFQITLNQIAELANFSTRSLIGKLGAEGVTFNQLASNVMLEKAYYLLNATSLSVKEIAQQLGYTKSTNFVRAFKNATQFTPDAFRAQC